MEQTVETVSWGLFWRFIKIMHKRAHSYANNIKAQQKVVIFTISLSPDPANWTNYYCKYYCEYPIIYIFSETSSASCFCSLLPFFPEFKCNSFSGILSQCCFLDWQHHFHKSNSLFPAPHISKWPLFSLCPLDIFFPKVKVAATWIKDALQDSHWLRSGACFFLHPYLNVSAPQHAAQP